MINELPVEKYRSIITELKGSISTVTELWVILRNNACKKTETRRKKTGGKTTEAKERGVGETGAKETGGKETRVKAIGVRETGGKVSGGKATGAQVRQETGGKGDRLMGERETDNSLPGDKAAGQNVMEGIQWKSYSSAVTRGEEESESVCGGLDS